MAYVHRGVGRWWQCRVLEKPKYPLPAKYYRPAVPNRPPAYQKPPSYSDLYPHGPQVSSRAGQPGDAGGSLGARPRRSASGRRDPPRSNYAEESRGARPKLTDSAGRIPLRFNTGSTLSFDDIPPYGTDYYADYYVDFIYPSQAVAAALAVSYLPGVAQARLATWHGRMVRLADVINDCSTRLVTATLALDDSDDDEPPSYHTTMAHDRQSALRALDSPPVEQAKWSTPGAEEDAVSTVSPRGLFGATARPNLESIPEDDELNLPLPESSL